MVYNPVSYPFVDSFVIYNPPVTAISRLWVLIDVKYYYTLRLYHSKTRVQTEMEMTGPSCLLALNKLESPANPERLSNLSPSPSSLSLLRG